MSSLRRLAEAATPGPWRVSEFGADLSLVNLVDDQVDRDVAPLDNVTDADAAYIAAASPDVILALLDRAEQAESAVERLRVALGPKRETLGPNPEFQHGWNDCRDFALRALDPATSLEGRTDE